MTVLEVVEGDITTLAVDAVVNAANRTLLGGGGVDGAIHRAAGPSLLAECRAIADRTGGCETGDAVVTGAGELPARWVIHTVGPIWSDHDPVDADRLLASCYRRALALASEVGARSVAFPNISTGVYGFPKKRAAAVSIAAVRSADTSAIDRVIFCCFDAENRALIDSVLSSRQPPP